MSIRGGGVVAWASGEDGGHASVAAVGDEQIESLASNWGRVHNVRIIDNSLFKNYVFTPLGYGSFGFLGTVGRSVFI